MEINFSFVKNSQIFSEEYPALEKIYKLYTIDDYRDVISNSRLVLEALTKKIFKLENLSPYYHIPDGQYRTLRSDSHYIRTQLAYPVRVMDLFDEVRRMGNAAIHDSNIEPDKKQAWRCICDIHDIFVFLINSYDGQKLYYIRPDIAMEAEASDFHLCVKNVNPHVKLKDHQTKRTKNQHQAHTKLKKAKYFSSSKSLAEESQNAHKSATSHKENWFTRLFHRK